MNARSTGRIAIVLLGMGFALSLSAGAADTGELNLPQSSPPASLQCAEVVYEATGEKLTQLFADQPEILFVLSRKDNQVWCRRNDGWEIVEGPLPRCLMNVRTGTIFLRRNGDWATRNAVENVQDWGARGDYSTATMQGSDDTEAIQAAIDAARPGARGEGTPARVVYLPAGRYLLTSTLNLTTDFETSNHCQVCIRGDGMERTVLYGSTGGLVMDFTGSVQIGLEDFSLYSYNTPNPSTAGMLFARGKKNAWAICYRVSRVDIRLHSDPGANEGIGTVAIWNFGGEHHTYTDLWAHANLPVVLTRVGQPETLPARIESPFVEVLDGYACSQHFTNFVGTCVLVAYDYHRPCLLVNRAAEVHLIGTYMSIRPGVNPAPQGTYGYAVELSNVAQYIHYGQLEGPGMPGNKLGPGFGYMQCPIDVEDADVRVLLCGAGEPILHEGEPLTFAPVEFLSDTDWRGGIHDSQISIRYPVNSDAVPERFVQLAPGEFEDRVSITNSRLLSACERSTEPLPASILERCENVSWYDHLSRTKIELNR